MKTLITALALALLSTAPALAAEGKADTSTRRERNLIVDGNRLFRDKRYADAEVAYKKALEINPNNETALYNLASSYLRQDASPQSESFKEAVSILGSLAKQAEDISIAELSFYNLGNVAFNAGDYAGSIEQYKNALRRNPDNDKARENLRLAQKRLEEQQNQNQDQNQNEDKQDQQDKQDQKDQKQNKDQDKNQDQNKDKDKDKDKDQDKHPQQPQQQDKQQQQQQPQPQGGISQQNAEKILKTMENEENATRQRVNAERQKSGAPERRPVSRPW